MGWGLEVPGGWTRGEPVVFHGTGPRYTCSRDVFAHPVGTFDPNTEISIVFDSLEEANSFNVWWHSPPTTSGKTK